MHMTLSVLISKIFISEIKISTLINVYCLEKHDVVTLTILSNWSATLDFLGGNPPYFVKEPVFLGWIRSSHFHFTDFKLQFWFS